MKINLKKVITIMVCVVVLEVVYLIGFYTPNKVVYGNSEIEISAENPTQNLESDLNFENEFLDCDADLTIEDDCDIIIADDESDVNEVVEEEIVEEEIEEIIEVEYEEPTLEDILIDECPFVVIDEIYEIDSYEEGNWYCYYIYADGDIYVVTLKNDHVDVCVQLN